VHNFERKNWENSPCDTVHSDWMAVLNVRLVWNCSNVFIDRQLNSVGLLFCDLFPHRDSNPRPPAVRHESQVCYDSATQTPQFYVSFPEKLPKIVATRGEIFTLKFTKYHLAAPFGGRAPPGQPVGAKALPGPSSRKRGSTNECAYLEGEWKKDKGEERGGEGKWREREERKRIGKGLVPPTWLVRTTPLITIQSTNQSTKFVQLPLQNMDGGA